MEIKAKCKCDINVIKALTHLGMFRKADPKKRMILWAIVYAVLLVIIAFEIVIFGAELFLLIACGLAVFVCLLGCYLYFLVPHIRYNAMAQMKDIENEYIFCDNAVKSSTRSAEYNGEAEMEYSLFIKVYETSKYFFMYQTNNQVFVVDKSTVVNGSVEDIRNKLSCFLKDKYFICKY